MAGARGGDRRLAKLEGECVVIESGGIPQFETAERPEQPADAVELQPRAFQPDLEALVDVFIEVIEQHLPGLAHA